MPIVENPLRDSAWNWNKIVTPEHPRKCTTCRMVYPPDYPDAPLDSGAECLQCVQGVRRTVSR